MESADCSYGCQKTFRTTFIRRENNIASHQICRPSWLAEPLGAQLMLPFESAEL